MHGVMHLSVQICLWPRCLCGISFMSLERYGMGWQAGWDLGRRHTVEGSVQSLL